MRCVRRMPAFVRTYEMIYMANAVLIVTIKDKQDDKPGYVVE